MVCTLKIWPTDIDELYKREKFNYKMDPERHVAENKSENSSTNSKQLDTDGSLNAEKKIKI